MPNALTRPATPPADPLLIVDVWLAGEPLAMRRHRFNRNTGTAYTDPDSRVESQRQAVLLKMARPARCDEGRVEVQLTYVRSTRAAVDLDNLAKMTLDAAKGVLWKDDAQVFRLVVTKYVGAGPDRAGVRVVARRLPE